jgi:hemerythrin-like domain-containing protein
MDDVGRDRRVFLAGAAGTGLVLIAGGARAAKPADGKKQPNKEQEKGGDIPPTEDLMREHGVLRRVLLVYDEAARRLTAEDASALAVVASAANIVHRFVEGYHEKLEEELVFPKLEKAGKLTDLTKTLRAQHAAGRKLTDAIMKTAKAGKGATAEQRRGLGADLQAFGRMYAPHAAWEDTELFPIFREQFTEAELDKLGEQFEDQEHKLLGSGGFEGSLKEVGELEKALGIHDLAKFTPA